MIWTIWTILDLCRRNGPARKSPEGLIKSARLDHWTFCRQSTRVRARVYKGFRPILFSSFYRKKVQWSKKFEKSCFYGWLDTWTIEKAMVQKVQKVQEVPR